MTTAVDRPRCGATKKRGGGTCSNPAGFRTDHPGQGRCWLHGGATPTKHGRYSTVQRARVGELLAKFRADPDPLNLHEELALLRALALDYIERYDEFSEALILWHASFAVEGKAAPKPRQILDLADAGRLVERIGVMVERIEKIRSADAISRPRFLELVTRIAQLIRVRVSDPATLDAIVNDLATLQL